MATQEKKKKRRPEKKKGEEGLLVHEMASKEMAAIITDGTRPSKVHIPSWLRQPCLRFFPPNKGIPAETNDFDI